MSIGRVYAAARATMKKRIDSSYRLRSLGSKYLCALVSVALAIGIRLILEPVLGQQFPFGVLNIAVAVTAWYGGTRPALVALFVGVLASELFVMGVQRTLQLRTTRDTVGLLLFIGTGVAISFMAGAMHRARERADFSDQSAQFRDAIIDRTFEPVLGWEWNGSICLWNRSAEQLYGFTRDEAMGRVSHDLLQTETAGGVAHFVAAMERDGRWEGELRHIGRDGHTVFVHSQMTLIRSGGRAFVLEASRDITDRKKREVEMLEVNEQLASLVRAQTEELLRSDDSLRASEGRNRLILAGVRTHAIILLDAAGNVVSWNSVAERITGYSAEEIVGKPFSQFYTPADVESGIPELELKIAIEKGLFEKEGPRVRKDGSRFWATVSTTPLRGRDGQLVGFARMVEDITERKTLEEALRTAESKFQLLVNGVRDHAILMLDPQGIILTWSLGAEAIDGYTADEIIGRHYSCLFTAEKIRQGEPERELARAAAEGRVDIEGWRIRKDGSSFWANGTLATLYDENGNARGFAKITRDLTTKRHDDELLQSVLNHTLDGIITIDDRGTVSMINALVRCSSDALQVK